ncbi:MAG: helix-turn-helix domain-containing protein [Planctomycetia bacterium]|nr:helix-turn-helix domain-containing protein [Planctomycetia bacterium]
MVATLKPRGPGGRPRTWTEPSAAGREILQAAGRRKLSLHQVAAAAGVSVATVYDVVSGRVADPRLSVARALARALRVPVDRLFPGA